MIKKYQTSLFIFRRDLRLPDNTGLIAALNESELVIPCFIFTPEQIGPENQYRSKHAIQFMVQSLNELNEELKKNDAHLFIFYGTPEETVRKLFTEIRIDALFVNKDYTPYSTQRDNKLKNLCAEYNMDFRTFDDALLQAPEKILNSQGQPYQVFTPFFKKNAQLSVKKPYYSDDGRFYAKGLKNEVNKVILEEMLSVSSSLVQMGGRKDALMILSTIGDHKDYPQTHNFPTFQTTLLSSHNKFGTVSIREVYYAITESLSQEHPLIRQLYWRDFFYHIAWFYPQVFGHAFHEKFDHLPWNESESNFERWRTGTTGFPIVDAGMRQLNQTGFMHNRVRLIAASFLVKDLHINWQWGEKYFAQLLTDYDPAVNNGNWQWIASTGCDHQPYFRIFNPWLQQKKFDSECLYIKKWVPELQFLDSKIIHSWYNQTTIFNNYPPAMIDHNREAARAKSIYSKMLGT